MIQITAHMRILVAGGYRGRCVKIYDRERASAKFGTPNRSICIMLLCEGSGVPKHLVVTVYVLPADLALPEVPNEIWN